MALMREGNRGERHGPSGEARRAVAGPENGGQSVQCRR